MGWRITAGKCLGNCVCVCGAGGGGSDRERDEGGEEEKQKTYKLLPSWKILSSSSTRVPSLFILHNDGEKRNQEHSFQLKKSFTSTLLFCFTGKSLCFYSRFNLREISGFITYQVLTLTNRIIINFRSPFLSSVYIYTVSSKVFHKPRYCCVGLPYFKNFTQAFG